LAQYSYKMDRVGNILALEILPSNHGRVPRRSTAGDSSLSTQKPTLVPTHSQAPVYTPSILYQNSDDLVQTTLRLLFLFLKRETKKTKKKITPSNGKKKLHTSGNCRAQVLSRAPGTWREGRSYSCVYEPEGTILRIQSIHI
jgi:hypothetical protein